MAVAAVGRTAVDSRGMGMGTEVAAGSKGMVVVISSAMERWGEQNVLIIAVSLLLRLLGVLLKVDETYPVQLPALALPYEHRHLQSR